MNKAIFFFIIAYSSCISCIAQTPPPFISDGIDALFQAHVNQTSGLVPGHVIRIEKPGDWVYEKSAGNACVTPVKNALPSMKFKIASLTKLFTTVAVFKMIESGQLDFNAPIGNYLPVSMIQGFDNYQSIKIKHLLSHTSGINDPQSDYQGRLNYWIYMKRFEDIPLDSLLYWSNAYPRGLGNYYYSNANFYLLAEVIKAKTGASYRNFINDQIIAPLGLSNTDFNQVPQGLFLRGYLKGSFYPIGALLNGGLIADSLYDFTEASNSWGYGAAELWSNTSDLIKFHSALFSGQLIQSKWLDTMKTIITSTGDMGAYGYGMMQFKSFNGGPVYGFGHTGTAFGYGSMLCFIPSLNVYMCSAGNYMKIGQEFLQRDIYNFLINNKSSLIKPSTSTTFDVFPNPCNGTLTVVSSLSDYQISLLDCTGKLVFNANNSKSLDLINYPKGLYSLLILDANHNIVYTKKIINQ
jgi:D-alanyl-D-alanine carboxypeptidase